MKEKLVYLKRLLVIGFVVVVSSCNDTSERSENSTNTEKVDTSAQCLKGLSPDEKVLIAKLISGMRKERKDNPGIFDQNTTVYEYTSYFESLKDATVEPIDPDYAALLRKNYDGKRARLEPLLRGQIREMQRGANREPRDASSVWVAADEFAPFFGQLLKYQFDSSTKTGVKIVFGSYPYNKLRDDMVLNGARTNRDSLSGRNTVYFVGTFDSKPETPGYFVTRHREIKGLSMPIPVIQNGGFQYLNHGTLCPDSCTLDNP